MFIFRAVHQYKITPSVTPSTLWHTLFLLDVFTALKGTHVYIFICFKMLDPPAVPESITLEHHTRRKEIQFNLF